MESPRVNGSHGMIEPLAVIGMSFRLPGGAETVESFWEMLVSKRSASTVTPSDRFNINAHYHRGPRRIGSMSYRGGHFMTGDSLYAFDAPFFGIGAKEAQAMDPVHRLTLETAYRALENAGLPIEKVAGSRTAVFAGSSSTDYSTIVSKDPEHIPKYMATGTSSNMMANRVSWFFNLTGPSVSVSAACSSSLVALDLTCQSIWSGRAEMGLACGGNVILTPEGGMWLDNLGMLSPDSQCYTLDSRANGFARGEGFGVLVIKPVSAAIHDGDPIRAVIRGTNSSSNGKTPGLTQPSLDAQYRLILDTYAKAGLDMNLTRYFEAHGTGTQLGDPIEFGAIGAAFGPYRSQEQPLYVGSVKSNIGHLEGASGIAGVIKAILVLGSGVIPPNANFKEMNPKIDAESLKISVAKDVIPWPTKGVRRASVQSFGFGGANSHVIIDDAFGFLQAHQLGAPQSMVIPGNHGDIYHSQNEIGIKGCPEPLSSRLLVWSSEDEGGIHRLKKAWKRYFGSLRNSLSSRYLADLAYTLACRRSHLHWRFYAVTTETGALTDLADKMTSPVRSSLEPKTAFIFTGQGSQWFAMGRELIPRYEVFKNSLVDAGAHFHTLGCKWDILDELYQDELSSNVNNALYSQPLCTALQVALVDLLRSLKIVPSVVAGHSSGEIAAAYCIGAISRRSAWMLAYSRGVLAAQLAETSSMKGGMLAVGLSPEDAHGYLQAVEANMGSRRLVIACLNSPTSVTISGDSSHLDHLQALLDRTGGLFSRRLKVDVAYHSFQMNMILSDYVQQTKHIEPGCTVSSNNCSETITMVSSVTGQQVLASTLRSPEYWATNLVSPVRWTDALTTICDMAYQDTKSISTILEIGPHSTLQEPSKAIIKLQGKERSIRCIPLLLRNVSAVQSLLEAAGYLHCIGHPVDLVPVNTMDGLHEKSHPMNVLTNLPEYPFNHDKTYWHESRMSKGYRFRSSGWHELLGVPEPDWNHHEPKWRHIIRETDQPWVKDHNLDGTILFPAAGMFVMVIEAAKQIANPETELLGFNFKHTTFHSVFKVPTGDSGIEVNLHMRPLAKQGQNVKNIEWYEFRIYTHDDDTEEWQEKCHGSVQLLYAHTEESHFNLCRETMEWNSIHRQQYLNALRECSVTADVGVVYAKFKDLGYKYGPAFQAITSMVHNGRDVCIGEVRTHREVDVSSSQMYDHVVHPATLDCIFQVMFAALVAGGSQDFRFAIPSHFDHIRISNKGLSYPQTDYVKVSASAQRTGLRESRATIVVLDASMDQVLVQIDGFRSTDIAIDQGQITNERARGESVADLCHNLYWKPDLGMMSAEQVQRFCDSAIPTEAHTELAAERFFTDVDFLVTSYIRSTLASLTPALVLELERKHHTRKYLAWMRHRIDLLNSGESSFSTSEYNARFNNQDFIKQVSERVAATNSSGVLYTTVGINLQKLLCGDMSPLDLLFRGELVKTHYYEMWDKMPGVQKFRHFLDVLVHKNPGATMLEVGAGSGSTTSQLMKILTSTQAVGEPCAPRFAYFDYTDVSSFFLATAQQQYRHLGTRIQFKKLDIERDPETQGFGLGSYDVVIASNVLHATSNVAASLTHCRKLLKPGGKLILWENTVPDGLRTNFVFGLLEGWWLAAEPYRQLSPCLNEDGWRDILVETGFTGNDVVLRDYNNDVSHEFSIIISTAVEEPSQFSPAPKDHLKVVLVHEPEQDVLAHKLKAKLACGQNHFSVRLSSLKDVMRQREGHRGTDRTFVIFLVELHRPFLRDMTSGDFQVFQELLTYTYKVLWVHRDNDPAFSVIDGVSRVVNSEMDCTKLNRLCLRATSDADENRAELITKLSRRLLSPDHEDTEYVEGDDGSFLIPRLLSPQGLNHEVKQRVVRERKIERTWNRMTPLQLAIGSPGLLSTLHFVESIGQEQKPLMPEEVEIRSSYAGVNFKDVLVTLGSLNDPNIGCEVAGTVVRLGSSALKESNLNVGDRVACFATGSFATFTRCDFRSIAKIPDGIDFPSAAAIPVNFVTAWYAFHDIARLRPGETVLVHSAAGGTGQAAVQVAQHIGAVVYATVGSESKRSFLSERYRIPTDRIFSSRDTSFLSAVRRMTQNKGVDVVLNSLSGDGLMASWECIAPYGRFIEIGKKDILAHGSLSMTMFEKNVSFAAVDVSMLNRDRPSIVGKALKSIFALTANGSLCPAYPLQIYRVSEIQQAFRSLQSGKTTGKVVIQFRADDTVQAVLNPKSSCSMDPNATYIIAGGLGGLGQSVARWLVNQGARNLILLSRSGGQSESSRSLVRRLTDQGAHVETPACDITDLKFLRTVIDQCMLTMPPIRGCIQAAMVLHDAPFELMTYDVWRKAILPKVSGSFNLHATLPKGMDFFIMLSSMAGVCGSRGQANYAAGNTYQDSLARYRVDRGERATALDLGPFHEMGWVASRIELQTLYAELSDGPVTENELHALLDYYCDPSNDNPPGACFQPQNTILRVAPKSRMAIYLDKPMFRSLSINSQIAKHEHGGLNDANTRTTTLPSDVDFPTIFAHAVTLATAAKAVKEALAYKVAETLGLGCEEVDTEVPIHRYGVDSLVAVELRNWVTRKVCADVATLDFMGSATVAKIARTAASKSKFRKEGWIDSSDP
ncbi:putative polyketide synthase [Biscogniauxia sp. FL1348]|nr:putative polyketide synthase [Biscogniauxia sp. FL1348]